MTYQYSLSFNDFLTYQLYTVSKSKRIKKKKNRSWILMPAALLIFGIAMSFKDSEYGFTYGILAAVWAVAYPFYFKWLYKRHFSKFIKENYANKIGEQISFEFKGESLYSKDEASEATIKLKEFVEFIELPNDVFLKTKTGDTLIIPKSMNEFDVFKAELHEKSSKHNIAYNTELEWKW